MKTMEQTMMTTMMVIVMMVLLAQVVQGMVPAGPQYQCPLCPEEFYTYEELYQHFTTEHPAEPIDIIWE